MLAVTLAAGAQPPVLQIRVVEGEGAVYPVGSRATRGVAVRVTDAAGQPVDGATVSFSLPSDGPGGVFASGSRTEVAITHPDGQAAVWGMQWNRLAGAFGILISASKGNARGGVVCALSLAEGGSENARGPGRGHKWLWITLGAVGAAAGAGVAAAGSGQKSTGAAAASTTGVQIGAPTILLGRP